MRRIIGIDPGATGAIAWLSPIVGLSPVVTDMPANPRDVFEELAHREDGDLAIIEKAQPMPKQGVVSTFTIGRNYGVVIGVLAALGIPYREVAPGTWKRAMGLDSDKEKSRSLARSLWPEAPLGRKKDHNRAEALLLAEWGRRQERE